MTSFSFFGFSADLEQSGGRTPDAESAKVMFFKISGQSLIKESCHNSRVTDHIDMELGPVTKPDKRNKTTSKKFDVEVMSKNCDVISFFGFLADLEQSGGQTPDAESERVLFSVTVTFCLTETENRTKKPLTQLSYYSLE